MINCHVTHGTDVNLTTAINNLDDNVGSRVEWPLTAHVMVEEGGEKEGGRVQLASTKIPQRN